MSYARSAQTVPAEETRSGSESRRLFFKADRPRSVDRYIDYFGGELSRSHAGDPCGEGLLEILR
jgi:hypothetical protein